MQTFDCPKCGAPVTYNPALTATARCAYCGSQLAVPNQFEPARILEQVQINVSPEVTRGAKKVVSLMVAIPVIIVVFVFIIIVAVFGMVTSTIRSVTAPFRDPSFARGGPTGSRSGNNANAFANQVLEFGSEGIGPGMMTDARSIGVDGKGNIYVGEYSGGRVQVFDASGTFLHQWTADAKMPLRGFTVDRTGVVYIAQRGVITRYDGETGQTLGTVKYTADGFDDVTVAPDGGLVCAWYRGRDDIIRFDVRGNVVREIHGAISTAADRSELNTRVAIDGRGYIYGLGSFTSGVFKFSPEGKFMNRFGGPGNQQGQISAASAIAVDGRGRVFVSDIKGVQIFDSDGRYLSFFKPDGPASGMVFDDKNELLVVERKKVEKFVLNQ